MWYPALVTGTLEMLDGDATIKRCEGLNTKVMDNNRLGMELRQLQEEGQSGHLYMQTNHGSDRENSGPTAHQETDGLLGNRGDCIDDFGEVIRTCRERVGEASPRTAVVVDAGGVVAIAAQIAGQRPSPAARSRPPPLGP